jgi:6-phosphogluconolactonase
LWSLKGVNYIVKEEGTLIMSNSKFRALYIGTYTRHESHVAGHAEGIYVYQVDLANGQLHYQSTMTGLVNPSFVTVEPRGKFLYAVNELTREEEVSGTVSAFIIDPATGNLAFLNKQPTGGLAPAYVSTDQQGRYIFVANYITGNVAVLPLQANGDLLPASDHDQHQGAGPDPRQDGPHAHSILPDPSGQFLLSADLGADHILIYGFDPQQGKLLSHDPPFISVPAGSGPRHMAFHPHGYFLYVVTECGSTILVFAIDGAFSQPQHVQTISTLPDDFTGFSAAADIHFLPHADGRFLYASNRGHDSIATFAVNPQNGRLTLLGHVPTQGKGPRNFAIDPAGNYLLAANQDTDSVVVFRINRETGALSPTGESYSIPSPVCLHLAPN